MDLAALDAASNGDLFGLEGCGAQRSHGTDGAAARSATAGCGDVVGPLGSPRRLATDSSSGSKAFFGPRASSLDVAPGCPCPVGPGRPGALDEAQVKWPHEHLGRAPRRRSGAFEILPVARTARTAGTGHARASADALRRAREALPAVRHQVGRPRGRPRRATKLFAASARTASAPRCCPWSPP